ncbi:hypothetical protein VTN00DRAFT_6756 [Thermoascus crustaceus]|uniref:uncharacterized protein n=1 Tax=Thermoascus crustaceus TaxID=5088 RepID=UPI003743FF50
MEDITPQEVVQALRELQNQVSQLENQLQERTGENTTLREWICLLKQQAEASTSHISNLTTQNPTDNDVNSKTKIVKLDLYYGDQKKLQTFIS